MAAKLEGDDDDIIADINVTPLVDIMLVLLIIFMVTATYIMNPSIKVDLPKAVTGDDTQASTLAIVLEKSGALYLNGKPITEQALADAVRLAKATKPDTQAIISADLQSSHGEVIHLIDLIKLNGVSRFAINIDPAARTLKEQEPAGEPRGGPAGFAPGG